VLPKKDYNRFELDKNMLGELRDVISGIGFLQLTSHVFHEGTQQNVLWAGLLELARTGAHIDRRSRQERRGEAVANRRAAWL
jgi:hypothetical protein